MVSAFFRSVPSGAVIRFSFVITSLTFLLTSSSNRRSRLVRIPTSFPFLSMIGIPPILFSRISFMASPMVAFSRSVTGSMIKPLSLRFTFLTCSACCAMLMFLCKIPRPPSLANAIARVASVTVSIAADSMGTFIVISFVSLVVISTSRGRTWLYAGINRTSSNVRPSPKNLSPARRSGEELLLAGVFLVAMCKDRRTSVYGQNGIYECLVYVGSMICRGPPGKEGR